MANARIAAIVLTLLSATLVAQPPPKTPVTVQVTDVTGAGVPRAAIEVTATPEATPMKFEADERGKAEFELPPGNYDLHVTSQGFCPFRKFLEPLNEQNHAVTAKLQIASCPGPCSGPCVTVTDEAGREIYPVRVSRDPLKVIVTDPTGAVIQRGNVEAVSTLPDNFGGHWSGGTGTNTLGEAYLDLPKGTYDLSVSAPGFKKWSTRIESGTQPNPAIRARMVVADLGRQDCMACGWDEHSEISPESAALSMIPIISYRPLTPLPIRRARRKIG